MIKIHADCSHPGLTSPDGEKKNPFLLTLLILEKKDRSNELHSNGPQRKHWSLRRHDDLRPTSDLSSLMPDREGREKGVRALQDSV